MILFLLCSIDLSSTSAKRTRSMSIEIHVLFRGKLPSKAALTRCFKEFEFPLRFAPGSGSLEQHKGYLPMRLRGEESGVEFDTYDGREAVVEIAGKETDPRFTRSANFRLGGDENELAVAQCFAAALARLVDGAVFDPQEGCLQTVEQAIDHAKKQIAGMAPKSKVRGHATGRYQALSEAAATDAQRLGAR